MEKYPTCYSCGATNDTVELVGFAPNGDEKPTCLNCMSDRYICDGCGYIVSSNWECIALNSETYCLSCIQEVSSNCADCGSRFASDELIDGYCEYCMDSSDGDLPCGHYTYCALEHYGIRRPKPGAEAFGVELELEVESGAVVRRNSREIQRAASEHKFVIKHDGSLENGYEFASIPYKMAELRTHACELLVLLREAGLAAYDTCGVHVHVNRSYLTPLQLGKMLVFMNWRHTQEFVEKVAGRSCEDYAAANAAKKITDLYGGDRYEALNTSNTGTVEFRVFAGTTDRRKLNRYFDFVEALIAFCEPAQSSLRELTVANFCKFVRKNAIKGKWRHLLEFCD